MERSRSNGKQAKRETISSASNISCPAQTELSKLVVGQLGGRAEGEGKGRLGGRGERGGGGVPAA